MRISVYVYVLTVAVKHYPKIIVFSIIIIIWLDAKNNGIKYFIKEFILTITVFFILIFFFQFRQKITV